MELETVLREVEGRSANDDYRDPGQILFFSIWQSCSGIPYGAGGLKAIMFRSIFLQKITCWFREHPDF